MALSELEWIMQHANRAATRLNALREILDRTDPAPKPPVVTMLATGPVTFTWETSPDASLSPTDRAPSRPAITSSSSASGRASSSSPSTDALADL